MALLGVSIRSQNYPPWFQGCASLPFQRKLFLAACLWVLVRTRSQIQITKIVICHDQRWKLEHRRTSKSRVFCLWFRTIVSDLKELTFIPTASHLAHGPKTWTNRSTSSTKSSNQNWTSSSPRLHYEIHVHEHHNKDWRPGIALVEFNLHLFSQYCKIDLVTIVSGSGLDLNLYIYTYSQRICALLSDKILQPSSDVKQVLNLSWLTVVAHVEESSKSNKFYWKHFFYFVSRRNNNKMSGIFKNK